MYSDCAVSLLINFWDVYWHCLCEFHGCYYILCRWRVLHQLLLTSLGLQSCCARWCRRPVELIYWLGILALHFWDLWCWLLKLCVLVVPAIQTLSWRFTCLLNLSCRYSLYRHEVIWLWFLKHRHVSDDSLFALFGLCTCLSLSWLSN